MRVFGPSPVDAAERYAGAGGEARFDHGIWDDLLARHVRDGAVDYDALVAAPGALVAYTDSLADAPFEELERDGKLALLLNAYNAFTLRLVVEHWPVGSIRDIPASRRWDDPRWVVGGRRFSLTQLEHEELRAHFVEPRVHFALNCASRGCPPLRAEAYVPERLEHQLEDQARQIHEDQRWIQLEPDGRGGGTARVTRLYLWYEGDFVRVAGSALRYIARYRPEVDEGWSLAYLPYDWSINARERDPR